MSEKKRGENHENERDLITGKGKLLVKYNNLRD